MSKTRLNIAQLKTLGSDDLATDSEVRKVIDNHVEAIDPHPQYLNVSENTVNEKITNRGVPGGYVPLDSAGLIPASSLPQQTVITIVQEMNMDGGEY